MQPKQKPITLHYATKAKLKEEWHKVDHALELGRKLKFLYCSQEYHLILMKGNLHPI